MKIIPVLITAGLLGFFGWMVTRLSEAAVQKVRDQYAESRTEKVEEKRIGRAVIRRRKKLTVEEEAAPAAPLEEAIAAPSGKEEVPVPPVEIQPEPIEVPEEKMPRVAPKVPTEKEPGEEQV